MTCNLTELKQRLIDLLIPFSSYMEVLPIHSNLRYTGHFSGQNFGLVENCKHLCLIVEGNYILGILMLASSDVNFVVTDIIV